MATPTLVATAGSASANTYLTLAEADAYHDTRLSVTDWTDATDDTKNKSLLMATRLIDDMFAWVNSQTDSVQALRWPRSGMLDANERDYIDNDVIPQELKNAVAELARQLIAEDRTVDDDIETKRITSLTAGPVSLSFGEGVKAKVIPDAVFFMIPRWWWSSIRDRTPFARDLKRG
jgi:hypothetical protein